MKYNLANVAYFSLIKLIERLKKKIQQGPVYFTFITK